MTATIGFIGAGNMARSLLGGLLQQGHPAVSLRASDPDADSRERVAAMGVAADDDNAALVAACDAVVLAVKPQQLAGVLSGIAPALRRHRPLLVSIAAGIPVKTLLAGAGDDTLAVVRAMPNTPALLGAGATGALANSACGERERTLADAILGAAGIVEWVEDESLLDVVTAVSGSGPAYFFLLMELVTGAGESLGLPPETARRLCVQTALGAARMADETGEPLAQLRKQVTSPGGTTAAALDALEAAGIRDIVARAVTAARDRGRALAAESAGTR